MKSDYYVYALFRQDGTTPFYIGKGRRRRWLRHEREKSTGNPYKDSIIAKIIRERGAVEKLKLCEGLTSAQACALEVDLILLVGRMPNGSLVNQTRGGEGMVGLSEPALTKMRAALKGRVLSPEHRAAIGRANIGKRLGKKAEPETRAKMSAAHKGRKHTSQHRENIRLALIGHQHSMATRAKLRAATVAHYASKSLQT